MNSIFQFYYRQSSKAKYQHYLNSMRDLLKKKKPTHDIHRLILDINYF